MTQQQLADQIGLTRTSVANIEAGRQDTTVSTVIALALALGESPTALLDFSTPVEPPKWAAVLKAENRQLRSKLGRIQKVLAD